MTQAAAAPLRTRQASDSPAATPSWADSLVEHFAGAVGSHARTVQGLALALFDALAARLKLTTSERGLLAVAALLHDVGTVGGQAGHQMRSRDLLLAGPAGRANRQRQAQVAWIAYLHGGWRDKEDLRAAVKEARQALPRAAGKTVLRLAAILRVADGLDYSRAGTSLLKLDCRHKRVTVTVSGPQAPADAARADAKAGLWKRAFDLRLQLRPVASHDGCAVTSEVEILPTDTVEAATLKTLIRFLRVLRHRCRQLVHKCRAEHVHEARVTAMRVQTFLELFAPHLPAKLARACERPLKRLRHCLGRVRDLDVLVTDLEGRVHDLCNAACANGLDAARLQVTLDSRRTAAATHLREYLADAHVPRTIKGLLLRLEHALHRQLAVPAPGRRLQEWLPVLVHEQIAATRALALVPLHTQPESDAHLHQLRIALKKLRYTLEAFQPLLGSNCAALIRETRHVQDVLGRFNDRLTERFLLQKSMADPAGREWVAAEAGPALDSARQACAEAWIRFSNHVLQSDRLARLLQPLFLPPTTRRPAANNHPGSQTDDSKDPSP